MIISKGGGDKGGKKATQLWERRREEKVGKGIVVLKKIGAKEKGQKKDKVVRSRV